MQNYCHLKRNKTMNKTSVTKSEFMTQLASYPSLFIYPPNPQTGLPENNIQKLETITDEELNSFQKHERTAQKHATYLMFSDGSRTDFNQRGKYSFFKYTFPKCVLYEKLHFTTIDSQPHSSHLYYLIRKE